MVRPVTTTHYESIPLKALTPVERARAQPSAPMHITFKTTINMPPQDRTAAVMDAFRRCIVSTATACCVAIVVAKRTIDTSGLLTLLDRIASIARE
jgi:hypothetical protein